MLARGGALDIPDLDHYYIDCVIGGPGAFIGPCAPMRNSPMPSAAKLILEIGRSRAAPPPKIPPRRRAPGRGLPDWRTHVPGLARAQTKCVELTPYWRNRAYTSPEFACTGSHRWWREGSRILPGPRKRPALAECEIRTLNRPAARAGRGQSCTMPRWIVGEFEGERRQAAG